MRILGRRVPVWHPAIAGRTLNHWPYRNPGWLERYNNAKTTPVFAKILTQDPGGRTISLQEFIDRCNNALVREETAK